MKNLLPPGCYDVLPPFARHESIIATSLLQSFESYGYEQVSPPLLEYSDHLLSGRGEQLGSQMFRVMDPASNRVMGIRPDITLQIARLASTILSDAPRPLRLCYNGLILRLQGEQLKTDRQLRQAGIELIGVASPEADSEVILVAAHTLISLGVRHFSIDLTLPSLASTLVADDALTEAQKKALYTGLSHKDSAAITALPLTHKTALLALMNVNGEVKNALEKIEKITIPATARPLLDHLKHVAQHLMSQAKNAQWSLTVDVTEGQGHAYHSGVGFSIFAPGATNEIGRGGSYVAGSESATGFTLYVETLAALLPNPKPQRKVLVTNGDASALRAEGMVTINALGSDIKEQAKRLGCEAIFTDGKLEKIP